MPRRKGTRRRGKPVHVWRAKQRVVVTHIERTDVLTSYQARYPDLGLFFKGVTSYDADVRHIVARMVVAQVDPPEDIVSIVPTVVGYVELMVKRGVWHVTTSVSMDAVVDGVREGAVTVKVVGIYGCDIYEGEGGGGDSFSGWLFELSAKFQGFDGFYEDAEHVVAKIMRTESPDFDVMYFELRDLVKMAYNARARRPLSA
jgi:hypothetical protein